MRGGKRTPAGGRPAGSTKPANEQRTIRKMVRFTPAENKQISTAVAEYGGRETEFMREAILEKTRIGLFR